jgi:CRISPR-associated protein Cmr3
MLDDGDVWAAEPRVGISRNLTSRTVEEGALYSTSHVRLHPGVSLGVEVSGVPEDWISPAGSIVPFGGESRLAACDPWNDEVALQSDDAISATFCIVLIALTPILIERDVLLGRRALDAGSDTRIVCATVDRPLRIGGWDSIQRRPLPLRSALAPGSTLFCEAAQPQKLQQSVERGLLRVGHATASGFGLCAVARTPNWERTP